MSFLNSGYSYNSMNSTLSLVTLTKSYCGHFLIFLSRYWGTVGCVCVRTCVFYLILSIHSGGKSNTFFFCCSPSCLLDVCFSSFVFSSSTGFLPDGLWPFSTIKYTSGRFISFESIKTLNSVMGPSSSLSLHFPFFFAVESDLHERDHSLKCLERRPRKHRWMRWIM